MLKQFLLPLCLSLAVSACKPEAAYSQTATPAIAPKFTGIDTWINSEPLTMAQLRGKVVLVEFWTYSCINCINVIPHVTAWHQQYKEGLVVVGVHSPEFGFEKITDNVKAAVAQYGISYPVAQDNSYATWKAYGNMYWPALYLIDQGGRIVYWHFGEGDYAETEAKIQQLLEHRETAKQ